MKKVVIEPGCISCGTCAFIAPDVFEVTDVSRVKPHVDFNNNEKAIQCAVINCPVSVITYKEQTHDE